MSLTKRQERVLKNLLAFMPYGFEVADADVQAFFAYTDRGVPYPSPMSMGLTELLLSWRLQTKTRSGFSIQQQMWLEGHWDSYSIGGLQRDFILDALRADNIEAFWLWHRPAYDHLMELRRLLE